MGKFTNKILAEFQPPRKWKLGRDLVYTTTDLYANEIKALKDVGVSVVRDTNKTETITVPSEFITDLASTPRIQWAFARVNSFTTKSSGTWGKADSDLAKQVRGS